MKKSLIAAAALCACAGAAQAQSSVTLYGVVDAPIEYVSNMPKAGGGSANLFRMASGGGLSGSRWGLRGTEDLGGGNQALFVLESGFGIDNGTSQQGNRLFGRQAFVGLNNNQFGKITLGRQYTTIFDVLANFSPTGYATMWEPMVQQLGLNFRSDNTAKYTGTFGPVTAEGHWSFGNGALGAGEAPGQFRRDSGYGLGASYIAGPLGVGVAYDQYNPSLNGAGGATGTIRKAAVAASYSFGSAIKVMAGYRWGQAQAQAGLASAVSQYRDDYYWAGVNYQATAALGLTLGYSYDNLKSMATSATTSVNPPNPWQVQLVADYNLSKRTDVYVMGAYAKNAGLGLDNPTIAFANGYQPATGKDSMVGVAVGLRHKF